MADPRDIVNTKATETKRYYARIPGSRFICPHCSREYTFFFGKVDVDTVECQNELDYIVRVGNPTIFTQDIIPEEVKAVAGDTETAKNIGKSEAEIAAQDGGLLNVRSKVQQEVGQIPRDAGLPSDPNKSTADPALARAFAAAPKQGTPVAGATHVIKKV